MRSQPLKRSRSVMAMALIAILFGTLTVVSGGAALFNDQAQQLAGDYVGFVLWFNFLAGFSYVIAGVGLWMGKRWSLWLSVAIAAATLLIFVAFGIQVWRGGSYELRTVGAMGLRTTVWIVTSVVAYRNLVQAGVNRYTDRRSGYQPDNRG